MTDSSRAPRVLHVRRLGCVPYLDCWRAMQRFTDARTEATEDALWLAEHPSVFTQGQAGRAEHLLAPGDIPVVQTDRGGQVTYHGPGQLIAYVLVDLRRLKIGVRALVSALEGAVIDLLAGFGVGASARPDAPGVYVDGAKIASVGLRVRHGCSYHGIALNVDLDLAPFRRINPCGYAGLAMTRLADLVAPAVLVKADLPWRFAAAVGHRLGMRPAPG
ncbi:MAG: lipoyl(octanoyl) transferase LipB [Thiohalocapsa sp.]|jgi:lipoyl(octanoyl) transferase|uniref:lipoyl(octanoyl) transferase LipB n=1 Tax=Thiohalocapsa sp. TaxID=2497641 RepID=UPI0025D0ABC4|nr:lipoyl(octanoyl) transferase LipB [Thiohalocapsa sp.]MCG6939875.1 lipoyl(octanoyl) transferase LipB [Thiohalocapsa sp.]